MISLIGDNLFDGYLLCQLLCCEKCLTDSLSEGMTFFNPIRQDVLKLLLFMNKNYINKRRNIINVASKTTSHRILVKFQEFYSLTIFVTLSQSLDFLQRTENLGPTHKYRRLVS